jgi:hypothetical protein
VINESHSGVPIGNHWQRKWGDGMTAINRKKPGQGDWGAAANRSPGTVLTLGDAATIRGLAYILTISSADLVNSQDFNAVPGRALGKRGFAYDGRLLAVTSGVASLNGASTMAASCSNARDRRRRRVGCQHSLN